MQLTLYEMHLENIIVRNINKSYINLQINLYLLMI